MVHQDDHSAPDPDKTSPGGDVTVDEMSEASFPASDAPKRWTWEVRPVAPEADDSDDSPGPADASQRSGG
jgi:hypothetical protein